MNCVCRNLHACVTIQIISLTPEYCLKMNKLRLIEGLSTIP